MVVIVWLFCFCSIWQCSGCSVGCPAQAETTREEWDLLTVKINFLACYQAIIGIGFLYFTTDPLHVM
jgi:hypothetical protein